MKHVSDLTGYTVMNSDQQQMNDEFSATRWSSATCRIIRTICGAGYLMKTFWANGPSRHKEKIVEGWTKVAWTCDQENPDNQLRKMRQLEVPRLC